MVFCLIVIILIIVYLLNCCSFDWNGIFWRTEFQRGYFLRAWKEENRLVKFSDLILICLKFFKTHKIKNYLSNVEFFTYNPK